MTPRRYYRGSLVLPVLLPILVLPFFGESGISAILWLSLGFGGIAYLFYGAGLFYWLGKLTTSKSMRRLTYIAPVLFVPVQALFWLGSFYIQKLSNPELVGGWEGIPAFAVYILILGYSYVAVVNAGYFVFSRFGFVQEQSIAP